MNKTENSNKVYVATLSHVALTRVAVHEGGQLYLVVGSSHLQHHIFETVEGGALGVRKDIFSKNRRLLIYVLYFSMFFKRTAICELLCTILTSELS